MKLDESATVGEVAVDGKHGPGVPIDVDDVIALAAVLVGLVERAPARGEREPAVVAAQVP